MSSKKGSANKPINVWDTNAARNKLEDKMREILTIDHDIIEYYTIFNIRIMLSILTVCFPAFAFVYEKMHPYPESKTVLIICVVSYFVLMFLLTAFMYFIEKQCFFQGKLFILPQLTNMSATEDFINDDDVSGKMENEHTMNSAQFICFDLRSKIKRFDPTYTLNININQKPKQSFVVEFPISDVFQLSGFLCEDKLRHIVNKFIKQIESRYHEAKTKTD
ncbi:hypothetical protein GJ496_006208 [Pomphorhynchus laevis]|nr:hypothetical protein GJ496_006208 [Pomphorhynchus laevis]